MLVSSSSYITLNMSYFDNNSAGRDGGVIIADSTNNLNGYNSLFHSNVAGNNGRVMYITLSSSIALENSSFEGNRSDNKGGVIYVKDRGEDFGLSSTHVTLKNKCNFYNNSAIEGGVTYILEAVLSDLGSVYSSNKARRNGGVTTLCAAL